MATTNYKLPTITGNMTADVVRDMNALAEATDGAIKKAVDGVDLSTVTQQIGAVDQRVTTHLAEKVHEGEAHGLRGTLGKLEFFDGTKWRTISGWMPVGNVQNFVAITGDKQVTLTWGDPEDLIIDGKLISSWKGTKILRKEGSYPENENDGVLVLDNGVRNQYASNGFTDTGLTNDKIYYYMAFPYSTENVFTVNNINRVEVEPLSGVYFYRRGNEYKHLTGGWVVGNVAGTGTQSKEAEHLFLAVAGKTGERTFVTNTKVNLSRIKKLKMEFDIPRINANGGSINVWVRVASNKTGTITNVASGVVYLGVISDSTTLEADVSSLSGDYHIHVYLSHLSGTDRSGEMRCYRVWGEE